MYTSLIRPILTYASFVWVSALEKEYKRKMLEKVQRQGCLLILSSMRSTPPAGMEVILGIRPIEVHIKELDIKSYLRLVKNGNWKHIKGEVTEIKHFKGHKVYLPLETRQIIKMKLRL